MPTEHDDDDHDKPTTTTISGTIQPVTPVPTATSLLGNPTDHPDRPVNEKPAQDQETTPTASPTPSPSATGKPSSWLPSFFPTFGVSSKTQNWIYGAAALIIVFCLSLGVYLWMARRKRLRNNPRDEWEFDLLEEDEADGLSGGGSRVNSAKRGGKRRAGELYDAFAAGSDEESEVNEYQDEGGDEGGDEAEKRLYDDTEEEEPQHVVGADEDEFDEKPNR